METKRTSITGVYVIRESRVGQAIRKLGKLQAKVKKLGFEEPLAYRVDYATRTKEVPGWDGRPRKVQYQVAIFTVTGPVPKLEGHIFAAVLQHTQQGNIIRATPHAEAWADQIPNYFRETGQHCDHCNTERRRNDTFLLLEEATGGWKQVGRNCLADFLGGHDPYSILEYLEALSSLRGIFGGDPDEQDDYPKDGRPQLQYPTQDFLEATAAMIRLDGWISRKKAYEDAAGHRATADTVLWLLSPPYTDKGRKERAFFTDRFQDQDKALAADVLLWAKETLSKIPVPLRSNYEHNLTTVLNQEWITEREAGIAASAIVAYQRTQAKKKEQESTKDEFFGEPGKRYEFVLEVLNVIPTQTAFGLMHIVKFRDTQNIPYTWFSSQGTSLQPGTRIKAKFTVKKHDSFRGAKQTVLTRPANMETIEETLKV